LFIKTESGLFESTHSLITLERFSFLYDGDCCVTIKTIARAGIEYNTCPQTVMCADLFVGPELKARAALEFICEAAAHGADLVDLIAGEARRGGELLGGLGQEFTSIPM